MPYLQYIVQTVGTLKYYQLYIVLTIIAPNIYFINCILHELCR